VPDEPRSNGTHPGRFSFDRHGQHGHVVAEAQDGDHRAHPGEHVPDAEVARVVAEEIAALTRLRADPDTRASIERRLKVGMSKREVMSAWPWAKSLAARAV
jgi:hypothetical protein